MIRRQTQQLARLLDDLLDMARITSGRIELEREHIDMRPIVQEALETERQRIEQKRQHVTLALGTHPVMIVADPSRLRQMIGNLVNNAWKYPPLDGSISITLAAEGDNAVLRVLDNGVGIPPDVKDKVFNPFFTTKPAGEGTGLGLSMSHDIIVKQHGGSIDVETELGHFTEFKIVLPRRSQR